ncbi:MAG TPA: 50S ribosomal protein L4 [Candidatus Thermoplasmatota archaeon]|nr:50S ribosomal protein L4 [Candidatus Thermoplasmatota archaeon]
MVKVNVYNKTGGVAGQVDLPAAFTAEYRPDLIRKAVNTFHANARQPYGASSYGGKQHAERSVRSGQGISRVPRMRQGSKAVFSPAVVGGRRAHPPKVERVWAEKINKKEKLAAFRSALAALASAEMVSSRGHQFKEGVTLPVVLEDTLANTEKTSDVVALLEALGLGGDLERADAGHKQRPGRGKMRGRRFRTPRSVLVVAPAGAAIHDAARNIRGVETSTPENLNVDKIAPGGDAGRLTVFTASALRTLEDVQ